MDFLFVLLNVYRPKIEKLLKESFQHEKSTTLVERKALMAFKVFLFLLLFI